MRSPITRKDELAALENLIDRHSLTENWQDETTARVWTIAAEAINKLSRRADRNWGL